MSPSTVFCSPGLKMVAIIILFAKKTGPGLFTSKNNAQKKNPLGKSFSQRILHLQASQKTGQVLRSLQNFLQFYLQAFLSAGFQFLMANSLSCSSSGVRPFTSSLHQKKTHKTKTQNLKKKKNNHKKQKPKQIMHISETTQCTRTAATTSH